MDSDHITTIALTGNSFIAQDLQRDETARFKEVADVLRQADVALTNLECAVPDPEDPPAFVAGSGWGATYLAAKTRMLEDLKYIGFDGVCAANNHVSDFGDAGVLSTVRHLSEAGLAYSGIGASLTEAGAPGYIDTAAGLRVAFISVCDWGPRGSLDLNFPWPAGYMPSDEQAPFASRPGVNLLRYEAVSSVTAEQLRSLRQISADLGWETDKVGRSLGFRRADPLVGLTSNLGVEIDTETEFHFMGRRFVLGDEHQHQTLPCQDDLERIYTQIREARRQADVVLVSLHDQSHGEAIHTYIDVFAHGAIDQGADIFFNNGGSHHGIELYKGSAIFYGVPNFFLQTEATQQVPRSAMERFHLPLGSTAGDFLDARSECAQNAIAAGAGIGRMLEGAGGTCFFECDFDDTAKLTEIRLRPMEPLGGKFFTPDDQTNVPRFRRQMPLLTGPDNPVGRRVIEHNIEASKEFGTEVVDRGEMAVIKVQ